MAEPFMQTLDVPPTVNYLQTSHFAESALRGQRQRENVEDNKIEVARVHSKKRLDWLRE